MNVRVFQWLCIIIICLCSSHIAIAQEPGTDQKTYTIGLPTTLIRHADTSAGNDGDLYYDNAAGIILMISTRSSHFRSVKEYMDCSNKQLEGQLRSFYSDSTLQLFSCSRSPYYPKETVVLNFSVGILSYGFNTCLVYFIHHKGNDLQFSFTYDKETAKTSMQYIDDIMKTLKLK